MTQLAQQIIEENIRSQNPILDLGNCGLTELPDLSGMDWVETLILSDEWWEYDDERKQFIGFKSQNRDRPNRIEKIPTTKLGLLLLKKLFARNAGIGDVRFLENLTNLTILDLSTNKVSDAHFLENLTNLTTLNLSFNKIIDARFLEKSINLTNLYLRKNQISDVHFLEKLTKLKTLDLRRNQISDARFLENLTALTSLNLGSNQISDTRFLKNLTNLISLNLGSNQISDAQFLSVLNCLTSLNLWNNQISDTHFLKNLTNLETLYLGSNQISDIRYLKKLVNLRTLSLSSNQISDTRFLERLTKLTTLSLRHNQIRDVRFLENFINLTTLNLGSNQISDAHFLGKLTNLTMLGLRSNQISDTRFLDNLTKLNKIDLVSNQLTDLAPLRYLFETKGMQVVWKNQLEPKNGEINVKDNPLSSPPVNIVQQGNEAIINYFKQIAEQGTAPLYEARLIMVGEPGAGKTSLTEKLLDETHAVTPEDPKKKSTIGINIKENWRYEDCRRPGENFTAHIWDFGGQEIQYMTHQFFLTPEAMYVLVADDRKQHTLFPYWFEVIRLLGKDDLQGHSPVLVVLNERNSKSITNFDLNSYRLRYPDMNIQVCEVDLCDSNLLRFRQLRQKIQEALCHLPHVGRPLPARWPRIREHLTTLKLQGRNHISMPEFRKLCAAHKVVRDEDLALISLYLHRLGAILHFQQDRSLRDFIVISPAWALKAMYAVLEDKAVEKANGFFTDRDLDRYWDALTDSERDNVLKLMKKESFEVVYPVDGGYVAPQLLSKVRPQFDWDSSASLKCRFYYRFMPKGILTRLIVRKHAHIKTQAQVWARGVVLHFASCDILVVEQETEKDGIIQIEVRGKGREGIRALDFVRNEIEEIHKKWFSNIDFQPMVPCDCEDCQRTAEPAYFKLESLIKRLDQNRHEIECENIRVKDVPIRRLLEGVYSAGDIAQKIEHERGMNIHVHVEDRKAHEKLDHLARATEAIETNTHLIQSNQHVHTRLLETLLRFAKTEQTMLHGVFDKIDTLSEMDTADLRRIDEFLEDQFGSLLRRLPDEHEIVAAWKKATEKAPDDVDMKWKLKFKLPLIFGEVEKELTWDGKKMLKSIREEITAYSRGERSFRELFWEA